VDGTGVNFIDFSALNPVALSGFSNLKRFWKYFSKLLTDLGIIFEELFAHILVTQFLFLFQVSKIHPECLKLHKNLRNFIFPSKTRRDTH
jgi:hypothetical protein